MRQTVMAMPALIGRGFTGFLKERVNAAVDRAEDLIRQALETFAKTQAAAVPSSRTRSGSSTMLLKLRRSRLDRIKALCATGIAFLASSEVAARDAAVPKPRVDIVDWIHGHVYVPPDSSERPGPLRLTKLQQGIFRSFQEPGVERGHIRTSRRFSGAYS